MNLKSLQTSDEPIFILPQITDAIRAAFIKNTDITDAHGWVFSRIRYSCSAAYCMVFDAPSAQRMGTDFFACGVLHAEMAMRNK